MNLAESVSKVAILKNRFNREYDLIFEKDPALARRLDESVSGFEDVIEELIEELKPYAITSTESSSLTSLKNYQTAFAKLNDDPRNYSLLSFIQVHVNTLNEEIAELEVKNRELQNAHKIQQLSEVLPEIIEELKAIAIKYELSLFTAL